MNIAKWCTRIITWSFALLFILVPFILTSSNYELFEYNKMMITYALTVIVMVAWLIKMMSEKEVRIGRTPLDIPIAIFFGSQLIATLFSMDPHVSWLGYYSRFNGGMVSVISYILLYYAFISNVSNGAHVTNLVKIMLAVAVGVALYAALEHFGYSISCLLFTGKFDVSCWVQDVQNRVFATLGQPNWLAAYLAALLPMGIAFAIEKKVKQLEFWVWAVVSVLFFAVLLFTKSRSGLIGFAIADVLFWIFLILKSPKKQVIRSPLFQPTVILHLAFAAIIFFTGTNIEALDRFVTMKGLQIRTTTVQQATPSAQPKTDTLLSTGGTESGIIRKYVWEGALTAWKSSVKTFFIGTGTETFAFAFYQFKPQAHNLTSEWDFLYNKAHNEYLNYLATTGILGLGSYLIFLGSFILWFAKIQNSKLKAQSSKHLDFGFDSSFGFWILSLALFSGWLSILITNFFGFSVVIIQLFLFFFPAMIFVLDQQTHKSFSRPLRLSSFPSWIFSIIVSLVGIGFLYVLARFWFADTNYAKGYQFSRMGRAVEAKNFLTAAIDGNPLEPVYNDEQSVVLAELAVAYVETHDATTAALLARQSLQESDRAIAISPNNVNFWKSRTKIYYAFSAFDPQFTKAAIEALQKARVLAPTDPKILYNLAILSGKEGDSQKAIEMLRATIDLKPNYRDAYAALVIFYKETKQPAQAQSVIEKYLTKVDPNDQEFIKQKSQL